MGTYTITFKPNPKAGFASGTGSYTVPANFFANVTGNQNSTAFEIDGNQVLAPYAVTPILKTNLLSGGSYTVTTGRFFEGTFQTAGVAMQIEVGGNIITTVDAGTAGNTIANSIPLKMGPGEKIFLTGSQIVWGYERSQPEAPFNAWVPEGTTINGGFWTYGLYPA